jgi:hypothetical protein
MAKPKKLNYYVGPAKTEGNCCPFCKGTSGYQVDMTETHVMNGAWGDVPESGDSGLNVKYGAAYCMDCKKKFRCLNDLVKNGLAKFPDGAINT